MVIPSLNAMRAFEAAARLGSIKDAAKELSLTPSAVSRHIRALEDGVGQPLFERGFRQVIITPRGALYARCLSEAFASIRQATEDVSAHTSTPRAKPERVRLFCTASIVNLWLADRLQRFRRAHPSIELEILTTGSRANFDLTIIDNFDFEVEPGAMLLIPVLLTPVCAPGLLQGPLPLARPEDLLHHHLIHECETTRWKIWLEREGITAAPTGPSSVMDDCTLIMREVVNGGGIALADTLMAEDLMAEGKLVAPLSCRHIYPAGFYLYQGRRRGRRPEVRLFQDWLLAEFAAHRRIMAVD